MRRRSARSRSSVPSSSRADIPVIGFAGAPFTLASYAIEGGTSKDFSRTKAFMLSEPAAWRRLLESSSPSRPTTSSQARAGAQALQVFDSWAGRALGREDYVRYVAPHNRELFAAVAEAGVPVVNFSLGVSSYLAEAAACGGDVVGLDWHLPSTRRRRSASSGRCRGTSIRRRSRPGRSSAFGSTTSSTRTGPARPCVQRRARARATDAGGQRAPSRGARARANVAVSAGLTPCSLRAGHGLRRAGVPRRDPGLPRRHSLRPSDSDGGARGDHGELPRDRRQLRPSPGHTTAGGSSVGRARRELQVLPGMRHWAPWIEEVVGEMVDDGITHAVSLVLAPQFSALSVARYQQKIADGLDLYRGRIEFDHVPSYHDAPGLVDAFARRVGEGLSLASRAGARSRRLQRPQPSGARPRGRRPLRRPVPGDGEPGGRARGGSRGAVVLELPVRGAHAGAMGRARHTRAPRGARRARRARRGQRAGRFRLRPRRAPLRHRPAGSGGRCEARLRLERPPALNDDPVFVESLAGLVRARAAHWLEGTRAA